jgi:hypothetical protein
MTNQKQEKTVDEFLTGKSVETLTLFHHFVNEFSKLGNIHLHPTKTMIGVANEQRRIAWITQLGQNFVHVVFPFEKPYPDNLCFVKIAQVPGDAKQFNHHFRMLHLEDVNEELKEFMRIALHNKI